MNRRFSTREFALLCAPVVLIAGVGWFASRRPAPVPLHLEFRVEKPTTLEAFKGANSVFVTRVKGDDAAEIRIESMVNAPFIELRDEHRTQIASSHSYPTLSPWAKVWKGQIYDQDELRLPVNAMAIPPGELKFNVKAQLVPRGSAPVTTAATPLPLLEKQWEIDRSQFAPFNFKALKREPQIRVRSVKIVGASSNWIKGETAFELLAAAANARTPVDFDIAGRVPFKGGTTGASYDSEAVLHPNTPHLRMVRWDLFGHTPAPPRQIGDLHGRISAGERWPLSFQIEPIDFAKVKAGQLLKFTQWPAPLPKP